MNSKKMTKDLDYFILTQDNYLPTLDLWEAENYINAVYVQSLIGNLVYYSNFGRYEPRLASHWHTLDAKTWTFYLRPDLKAENGELITGHSFKQSIERTLRFVSKKEKPPLFHKLLGFDDFIKHNSELTGITATDSTIEFTFQEPIRSGLLQVLSLAPYGYISQDNLNPDGSWQDSKKFISSGPYRVLNLETDYIQIEARLDWPLAKSNSPKSVKIHFIHESQYSDSKPKDGPTITDTFLRSVNVTSLNEYPLVPEYLNVVMLDGHHSEFLKQIEMRRLLKRVLQYFTGSKYYFNPEEADPNLMDKSSPYSNRHTHLTQEFYYHPQRPITEITLPPVPHVKPEQPLLIFGQPKQPGSNLYLTWVALKRALDYLGWPYEFSKPPYSMEIYKNGTYDIRMLNTSVGSPSNVWGREIQFCSHIGARLPDPGGRVCKLIQKYNKSDMDLTTFESEFVQTVNEQSSLVPLAYSGNVLYLSKSIDASTLSPMVSIVRFDQLGLLKNE